MGTPKPEGKRESGKGGGREMVPSVPGKNWDDRAVTFFFGGTLALLGNNSVVMESVFGKKRVHGRMYYIGDKRLDWGL